MNVKTEQQMSCSVYGSRNSRGRVDDVGESFDGLLSDMLGVAHASTIHLLKECLKIWFIRLSRHKKNSKQTYYFWCLERESNQ